MTTSTAIAAASAAPLVAAPSGGARRQGNLKSPRISLGFRDGALGAHSSRTMMLAELSALLEVVPLDAPAERYRAAVLEDNVLGKRTMFNRDKSLKMLVNLYGLDPRFAVFRLFRALWDVDSPARPLLAVLCSAARDPLLRRSAEKVVGYAMDAPVHRADFLVTYQGEEGRFSPQTLKSLTQNVASTWTQSGHLRGKLHKRRAHALATPATVAYAVTLGFLEGVRGALLLDTPWMRLQDRDQAALMDLLLAAARQGLLDVRHAGSVLDVRPRGGLLPAELEWCHALAR